MAREVKIKLDGTTHTGKVSFRALKDTARALGYPHFTALEKGMGAIGRGDAEVDSVDLFEELFYQVLRRGSFRGDTEFSPEAVGEMLDPTEMGSYLKVFREIQSAHVDKTEAEIQAEAAKVIEKKGVPQAPLAKTTG